MKSEELATQWCRDHPDATLEQAFMAGLGHKMNMNKDSLSARKDNSEVKSSCIEGNILMIC